MTLLNRVLSSFHTYNNTTKSSALHLAASVTLTNSRCSSIGIISRSSNESSSFSSLVIPNVEILDQGRYYAVINKPPSVECHLSEWTKKKIDEEIPLLQRIRASNMNGRRVNLIHRLDRGASGCLLCSHTCADDNDEDKKLRDASRMLHDALQSSEAVKTYVAITRGEGVLNGEDLRNKGWFEVDRPIKDKNGIVKEAQTMLKFLGGVNYNSSSGNNNEEYVGGHTIRASLVLARPNTGRWHQIRRHLNGLSHPILGDSKHGCHKTNRFWKKGIKGISNERICLHLARIQIPETTLTPSIDISSPIPKDMSTLLHTYLPTVLQESQSYLRKERITFDC